MWSSPRTGLWLRAGIALLLIWEIAGTAIFLLHAKGPGAGATITFLRQQKVASLPAPERARSLAEAADRLNQLTFEQMREVRESRALFDFYRPLDPAEKEQFAALIVPAGVRRILEASREIPPAQQQQFLQKAFLAAALDLSTPEPPIDPDALQRIQIAALKAYFGSLSDAERQAMKVQLETVREFARESR